MLRLPQAVAAPGLSEAVWRKTGSIRLLGFCGTPIWLVFAIDVSEW